MSRLAYDLAAPAPRSATDPHLRSPGLNPAAVRVLEEIKLWWPMFAHGETAPDVAGAPGLRPGERFAVRVAEVRASGLGRPSVVGALHVTDRRAVLVDADTVAARAWDFADVAAVNALANWGGVALVHPTGDTELIVSARRQLPAWRDAAPWLKVEAAFAAADGRLQSWVDDLSRRLALAADG